MDGHTFLGSGWSFPIGVDDATGRLKLAAGEEDVRQSITLLLGTRRGERVMRPEFGARLHEFVFESVTSSTLALIAAEAARCLVLWEPRITDVSASAAEHPTQAGRVDISISYTVRSTNNPYNLVYPFYMKEGANG